MASKQRCETCRFWVEWPSDDEEQSIRGWCHRNPPVMGRPDVEPLGGSDVVAGQWPVTFGSEFCGEWQAANPQTLDDAGVVMARHALAGDAGAARALADKLIELIPLPVIEPEPSEEHHDRDDTAD